MIRAGIQAADSIFHGEIGGSHRIGAGVIGAGLRGGVAVDPEKVRPLLMTEMCLVAADQIVNRKPVRGGERGGIPDARNARRPPDLSRPCRRIHPA